MFVKVCGISTAETAAVAASAGADAIGCVFYPPSARNIDPARARDVCRDLPAKVKRVAVMLHPSPAEWNRVRDEFNPDVLQTDAADFAGLDIPDIVERWPVLRELPDKGAPDKGAVTLMGTEVTATCIEVTATCNDNWSSGRGVFVYEGPRSGHGEVVDWGRAAGLRDAGDMILAGGLDTDNVATAIRIVRPFGVDVSSGVETAPGVKDPRRIEQFINAARAAETSA